MSTVRSDAKWSELREVAHCGSKGISGDQVMESERSARDSTSYVNKNTLAMTVRREGKETSETLVADVVKRFGFIHI